MARRAGIQHAIIATAPSASATAITSNPTFVTAVASMNPRSHAVAASVQTAPTTKADDMTRAFTHDEAKHGTFLRSQCETHTAFVTPLHDSIGHHAVDTDCCDDDCNQARRW